MKVLELAKQIKLLIMDVDGVLTDGKIFFHDHGVETKVFNTQDGFGIKMLQADGISVAVITGRQSELVTRRMQELKIDHVYQQQTDKFSVYQQLMHQLDLQKNQIAMVGDDLTDVKIIRDCGFGVAVANAQPIVKEYADYVTQMQGGDGAVREVCNLILRAQYKLSERQQFYLG